MGGSVRPETPAEAWDRLRAQGLSAQDATDAVTRVFGPPPSARPATAVPMPGYGGETIAPSAPAHPSSLREALHDFVLAAGQGASGGFGDELAAGTMGLVNRLSGKPAKIGPLLREAQGEVRAAAARSPEATVTGTLAGALAAPILASRVAGLARTGPALATAQRTGALAALGRGAVSTGAAGAVGGAVGFGSADGGLRERLAAAESGALAGAGFGAGLGAAGALLRGPANLVRTLLPRPATDRALASAATEPPVVVAAAQGASPVAAPPAPTRTLGMVSTERLAGEGIVRDIERSGLSVDEYLARARANPTLPVYDLGPTLPQRTGSALLRTDPTGDPLVRRARGVQSIPSRGSTQLSETITRRAEARPGEVTQSLERGMGAGRENTAQVAASLVRERAEASRPLYEQAFAHGAVDDPRINALIQKPIAADAWRQANRLAAAEGHELPQVFTVERTPTSILGRDGKPLMRESLVASGVPDVQTLHYLKLGIDDVIEANSGRPLEQGGISSSMAHAAQQQKADLLAVLDEIPAYKAARSLYAGNSEAMRAYDRGARFFAEKGDDLEHQWAQWSEADRDLYRRRAVATIEEELGRTGRPQRLLNQLTTRKLRIIFPDDASYQQFELALRRHAQGAANDATIMGGSPTARILAEQGDLLGGAADAAKSLGGGMGSILNPLSLVGRASDAALRARLGVLTEARADAFAPFLTATGSEAERRLLYLQALQREMQAAAAARRAGRAAVAGTVGGKAVTP